MLKTKGGWIDSFDLRLKRTSWACFLRSGVTPIFHWKAHSFYFCEVNAWLKTENNDVSLAKVSHWMSNFSDTVFQRCLLVDMT